MTELTITVVVPGSPDRILAPNRRAHGYAKAAATAQHRGDAKYAAMHYIHGSGIRNLPFTGPVSVLASIEWGAGERRKDLDSCAVMVKPYIDGLVDAGVLINDSQMKLLSVQQGRGIGSVILTVTQL